MINFVQNNPCIEYSDKVQVAVLPATGHVRNLTLSTANNECWGFAFKRVCYKTISEKQSRNTISGQRGKWGNLPCFIFSAKCDNIAVDLTQFQKQFGKNHLNDWTENGSPEKATVF